MFILYVRQGGIMVMTATELEKRGHEQQLIVKYFTDCWLLISFSPSCFILSSLSLDELGKFDFSSVTLGVITWCKMLSFSPSILIQVLQQDGWFDDCLSIPRTGTRRHLQMQPIDSQGFLDYIYLLFQAL